MKCSSRFTAVGVLSLLFIAAPAFSQQLMQPVEQATDKTKAPAPKESSAGPQLKQTEPTSPQVPSNPAQRPQSSSPISSKGPANDAPAPATRPQAPANPSGPAARVLDPAGVPLNGYLQVAPNRVYDPATNQYHWTVPAGEQQKIVK